MSESAPPPPPPGDSSGNQGTNPPGDQGAGSAPPPPPASGAPYSAAPPPAAAGVGEQRGGVLERFLARLIDGIIVGIVAFIISALISGGGVMSVDRGYADYLVYGIVVAVLSLAYWSFMESSRGQTIGKMALKLHVEGPSGGHPTMNEAVKRNLWVAIPILGVLGAFGYYIGNLILLVVEIVIAVQIGNDKTTGQSFADRFAGGTKVVKRP